MQSETQKERWIKYGANVVLSVVVAAALVFVVTFIAQRHSKRIDTTAEQSYSLKPQTVSILNHVDAKVRIIGLYPKAKDNNEQDYYQPVADLLGEYSSKGRTITTDMIDPVAEAGKLDGLISEVSNKSGAEVKAYKQLLEDFPKVLPDIEKFADDQNKKIAALPLDKIDSEQLQQTMLLTIATVQGFPELLQNTDKAIQSELRQKIPNYKRAVDSVRTNLSALSRLIGAVQENFGAVTKDPKAPKEILAYLNENLPAFDATKKTADGLLDRIKKLGELKQLDELRQNLKAKSILVMAGDDMKVVPFADVWRLPQGYNPDTANSELDRRLRFAGEQPINSALVSLTAKKKTKVAFIRAGGPSLTEPSARQRAPFSYIVDRLKQYNFDVIEKDMTGMSSMQAQMQGMPAPQEPSDEDLKDAVWVVIANAPAQIPQPGGGMMGMGGGSMPNPLGPKLAEHLKDGGSALVLFDITSDPMTGRPAGPDNLAVALKDWGVTAQVDVMAVHERLKATGRATGDPVERAQRMPWLFVMNEYGDHPALKPLNSLDALLVPLLAVKTEKVSGYTSMPVLPIPQEVKSWGERNWDSIFNQNGDQELKFNAAAGTNGELADVPNTSSDPLYAGAMVEKQGGGRLAVIGCSGFVQDGLVDYQDQELADRELFVSRFPGNAELFTNSLFWLSKNEDMLALSPAAMQVSRIRKISPGALNFLRVGVVIIGLPLAVMAMGSLVYLKRRD